MGLSGSQPALMPARVGHMRLAASRVGFYPATLTMTINGVVRRARYEKGLTIADVRDGTPNTASMRVSGFTPVEGQEIRFGLGGLGNGQLIFAGHILHATQVYESLPVNVAYDLFCISYEWLLNRRTVTGKFSSTSATDVVTWIMTHTSGFTTAGLEADLPQIDEITFTNVDVADALDRVKNRIGGAWVIDYAKVLHFGLTISPWSSPIHDITTADRHSMLGLARAVDLSQVRTRIAVTGGGSVTLVAAVPGATNLPVEDASWYDLIGGIVEVGPQHVIYTGVELGGGGAIVGTGVLAPTNALTSAAALGTGLTSGVYKYKTAYVTAAGETFAGPESVALTLGGSTTAPGSPPSAAKVAAGNLSAGAYKWKTTFVTAAGETTPGPESSSLTMNDVTPPSSALSAAKDLGGNLSAGDYRWVVTFVNAAGETTVSPLSGVLTMDEVAAPTTNGTVSTSGFFPPAGWPSGGNLDAGANYGYKYTFYLAGVGETTPSPAATGTEWNGNGIQALHDGGVQSPPVGVRRFYRTEGGGSTYKLMPGPAEGFEDIYADEWFRDYGADSGDASLGADAPSSNTLSYRKANLTSIPVSADPTVTARKLYRTTAGGSTYKLVATLNAADTTYADNVADASLGANAPSANTAVFRQASLTLIPTGDATVTSRKVYRTQANGTTFKLLTTIANNTTTTYSDNTADGSLGADAPTVSTSIYLQAALTNVPISPDVAVTQRKVYRTIANGSTFKLLTTIANNTGGTYADSTADGSLGANEPASDTSGLTALEGTVNSGSSTIPLSSTSPFNAGGGWVRIQSQVVRYTGKTTTTLTGIPTLGQIGALASSVRYGSEILSAPTLTGIPASGVGSILYSMPAGEAVNLYVERNDTAAQAIMAALVGGDGIHVEHLSDGRWSQTEAENRGDARLEQVKDPLVTITYQTRDMTTRSGRDVTIALDAPTSTTGTFTVQSVTLSQFGDGTGASRPLRRVVASSRRFSLEAILRLIKAV